jgi:hypothetical protein
MLTRSEIANIFIGIAPEAAASANSWRACSTRMLFVELSNSTSDEIDIAAKLSRDGAKRDSKNNCPQHAWKNHAGRIEIWLTKTAPLRCKKAQL